MQAKRSKIIRMPQISTTSASDAFSRYLRIKHAQGTKIKTLQTYEQHFKAIGHSPLAQIYNSHKRITMR